MYSFSTRVRYSETDASLQLSYPSIINYFQDCSIFHSEELGIGIQFLKERDRVWLMNSWQIEILRLPRFGETLHVNTWAYDFKTMFGYRNFTLTGQDDAPAVLANSVWVFTDTGTGHPTRVTEEYAAYYPLEPALPMDYAPRRIALPKEWTPAAPITVTVSHIDSNQHVNNAQYVAMASALLPCTDYRRLRVEYKKSARLGDILYPRLTVQEDSCTVVLAAEGGRPFAVMEFKK